MAIDQKVKDAVKAKVLEDLEYYIAQAEEQEDDETLGDPDMGKRLVDFYLFMHQRHF